MNDTAAAIIGQLIIVAVVALRWLTWDVEVRHERGGCNHDNPPYAKFCRRCGVAREPGRPRP